MSPLECEHEETRHQESQRDEADRDQRDDGENQQFFVGAQYRPTGLDQIPAVLKTSKHALPPIVDK